MTHSHDKQEDARRMANSKFLSNHMSAKDHFKFPVTDGLWQAIQLRDWKEVLYRVSHCPWDASFRLKKKLNNFCRGTTCLHLACLLRAPYQVVQKLVDAFRPALILQDKDGWSPLHFNLIYGVCQETTLLLIREGGPQAARISANYVGSPFHLACRHRHSIVVLRELLQQDPQQLKALTVDEIPPGRYPGDLIWHQRRGIVPPTATATNVTSSHANPVLERLYLCLAALRGDWDEQNHTLHEVLTYQQSWCSDNRCQFLNEYLQLNPGSVRVWYEERLPLHVAAGLPSVVDDQESTILQTNTNNPQNSPTLISVLLRHFPQAAAIPDRESGRFALHHALASGKRWSQGVNVLVKAQPSVVSIVDRVTGLFPAALAALSDCDSVSTSNDSNSKKETAKLDTVFQLLITDPSVLASSSVEDQL